MDDDRKKLDDLIDLVQGAMDLFEENEGKINSIMGEENEIKAGDGDPLKQLIKTEEDVLIAVEVKGSFDSVNISRQGNRVRVGANNQEVLAKIPSDCNVPEADANLNNGVLTVEIPRGE